MSDAKNNNGLDILVEDARWQDAEITRIAGRAAAATIQYLKLKTPEISLLACDDDRIALLNAEFRGKAVPTNVLSWPSVDRAADVDGAMPDLTFDEAEELGDIAIAYDICHDEAAALKRSFDDHATHLIVHGILHLLGFDHIRDQDAALMEGLETRILAKLGICDPYIV
ncbi:rRNA maturation RNase YbeY [Litoreibacter roseus]|uniref:Endoribonuclease YbeY n=1 Tax=Litoreibacter roseus TaxID=2601869 RepID=A0A6N6JB37_9RHOB|nr:rRNA maturation RNase YbeY [Litoreibacter roseus]GFE63080.1 endoribonuclease YbeY [Litoreibacter roseus]